MELPMVDLRERIEQELEINPALEILEDRSILPVIQDYSRVKTTSNPVRRDKASEDHLNFIQGALTRPETLQEHLLWQLQLEPADNELREIAETLIQNLNDDGFHTEKPETLFKTEPPSRLAEAMDLVRGLEPSGTCTNDYRESLTVQIALLPDAPAGIEDVLDNLELLERGKFSVLAKKIGLTENAVHLIHEQIKKLSPFPGRAFAPAEVRYVVPDVRVIREKDEFLINLNDETFPVLGINPFFEKLGSGRKSAAENRKIAGNRTAARDFARENIREARLFIQHLNQRSKTLLRVTHAIVEFQRSFFTNGPKYLAPLTLGDIARELDVHETTVSRTANGKYMQTEWGIFEIRHFFSNSISGTGSGGSSYSKEGVKEIIREIIAAENKGLSDQNISDLLRQRGIALARRTVAKYRKELDMGASYIRKV